MTKVALCQVADTGPLESLVVMLQSVGYECVLPSDALQGQLVRAGCDTVIKIRHLVSSWGYDQPMPLREISHTNVDVYVDIKAVRTAHKVWNKWPHLKNKTLWYRINGGEPEHVIKSNGFDCGDEVNPPCPILTPNRWYAEEGPWSDRAYSCWPPFHRIDDYGHTRTMEGPPIALVHNFPAWGFGALVPTLHEYGVRIYGVRSPDGLVQHSEVPNLLANSLAMVHLKNTDAPGYALYEALASGCPVIVSYCFIRNSHLEELLIPNETCLVCDAKSRDFHAPPNVDECAVEIKTALDQLSHPEENKRIGEAGKQRLHELMWREENDSVSLRKFMEKHFS